MCSKGIETSRDVAASVCHALSVTRSAEARNVPGGDISYVAYVENINNVLKGSVSQLAQFMVMCLIVSECSAEQLRVLLEGLLHSLLHSRNSSQFLPHNDLWFDTAQSEKQLVAYLVASLGDTAGLLTHNKMEEWLTNTPLAARIVVLYVNHTFLSTTDNYCFGDALDSPASLLLPLRIIHPIVKAKFSSQLLTKSAIILLNSSFPYECKGQLVPLFSTREHGESFSTLCKHIIDKGPTLIVVRDTGGHVFGGFCSDSWSFNPQFTGEAQCTVALVWRPAHSSQSKWVGLQATIVYHAAHR